MHVQLLTKPRDHHSLGQRDSAAKSVLAMAVGSIPALSRRATAGASARTPRAGVNDFIKSAVGLLLVVIPRCFCFKSALKIVSSAPATMKSFAL